MGFPVVIVPSGGLPVTEAANGLGVPVSIATNGFGIAVTVVASGGLPVVGTGPIMVLSGSSTTDAAAIGDLVGTLSVVNGSGSYTFTLTSNPGGLFSITGNQLKVAAALSAGNKPITVHADNGAGSVLDWNFTIVVSAAGTGVTDDDWAGWVAAAA